MSPLSALLAVLIVVGQPSGGPVAKLRTYVSPVDYLAPVYANPLPGATYLFYPGERVRVDVQVVNRSDQHRVANGPLACVDAGRRDGEDQCRQTGAG